MNQSPEFGVGVGGMTVGVFVADAVEEEIDNRRFRLLICCVEVAAR